MQATGESSRWWFLIPLCGANPQTRAHDLVTTYNFCSRNSNTFTWSGLGLIFGENICCFASSINQLGEAVDSGMIIKCRAFSQSMQQMKHHAALSHIGKVALRIRALQRHQGYSGTCMSLVGLLELTRQIRPHTKGPTNKPIFKVFSKQLNKASYNTAVMQYYNWSIASVF